MCTVSYLPLGNNNFILTSNRDENPKRKTIAPKLYEEDGVNLTYPKDELAGGTWIGVSNKQRLVCLLNGGFKKHKRKSSYRFSRGVIVKQLLKTDENSLSAIEKLNLEDIEPFTIILIDWGDEKLKAYELVWTGEGKKINDIKNKPRIWSSSTLYTDEMKELRKEWFADWLKGRDSYDVKDIFVFHTDETKASSEVSLKMKREVVETVSVTSVFKNGENVVMDYHDFLNENI